MVGKGRKKAEKECKKWPLSSFFLFSILDADQVREGGGGIDSSYSGRVCVQYPSHLLPSCFARRESKGPFIICKGFCSRRCIEHDRTATV